jgi:hypothetical protein
MKSETKGDAKTKQVDPIVILQQNGMPASFNITLYDDKQQTFQTELSKISSSYKPKKGFMSVYMGNFTGTNAQFKQFCQAIEQTHSQYDIRWNFGCLNLDTFEL